MGQQTHSKTKQINTHLRRNKFRKWKSNGTSIDFDSNENYSHLRWTISQSRPHDIQINASGQHIYPLNYSAYPPLGLVEIDVVRASDDESEITFNPHIRSIIAYNTESKSIDRNSLPMA